MTIGPDYFERYRQAPIGRFTNESCTMVISDPCYKIGTWCTAQLEVMAGNWRAAVEHYNRHVPRGLLAWHTEHVPGKCKRQIIDKDLGVDSGQLGIYDLMYYSDRGGKAPS